MKEDQRKHKKLFSRLLILKLLKKLLSYLLKQVKKGNPRERPSVAFLMKKMKSVLLKQILQRRIIYNSEWKETKHCKAFSFSKYNQNSCWMDSLIFAMVTCLSYSYQKNQFGRFLHEWTTNENSYFVS